MTNDMIAVATGVGGGDRRGLGPPWILKFDICDMPACVICHEQYTKQQNHEQIFHEIVIAPQ